MGRTVLGPVGVSDSGSGGVRQQSFVLKAKFQNRPGYYVHNYFFVYFDQFVIRVERIAFFFLLSAASMKATILFVAVNLVIRLLGYY